MYFEWIDDPHWFHCRLNCWIIISFMSKAPVYHFIHHRTEELIHFVTLHILKYLRGHVAISSHQRSDFRDWLFELDCAGLLAGSCMHKDTQTGHLLCGGAGNTYLFPGKSLWYLLRYYQAFTWISIVLVWEMENKSVQMFSDISYSPSE
jgi:hypothetical protein